MHRPIPHLEHVLAAVTSTDESNDQDSTEEYNMTPQKISHLNRLIITTYIHKASIDVFGTSESNSVGVV